MSSFILHVNVRLAVTKMNNYQKIPEMNGSMIMLNDPIKQEKNNSERLVDYNGLKE